MAAPRTTVWKMPELTPIKHRTLRRYLEWWLPSLLQQYEHLYIFDGFCGPGEYADGEIGSPLIAIDVLLRTICDPGQQGKVTFLFMDEDDRRCCHLQDLINRRKQDQSDIINLHYRIENRNFAYEMDTWLTRLERASTVLPPLFAFIDPFGFADIPMSIIARLLQHQQSEVLITLMFEPINRFLTHPDESIQRHFTALFGTKQWRCVDLIGDREQQLCDLYRMQLRTVCGVKYTCMFRLKHRKNSPSYFLVFGTHRRESLEKMKDVFWEIDPICGYTYSIYKQKKNAGRLPLFPSEPDYGVLTHQFLSLFRGTTMTIYALEEYILTETSFRLTGYREYVLKCLELTSRISVTSPHPYRKPGEYAATDLIHFL